MFKSWGKRFFVFLSLLSFLLSFLVNTSFSQNLSYYQQAAQVLKQKGIMTGDTKGNLNLDKPLKRSEISKMIIMLLGKKPLADFYANQKRSSFKDVKADYWGLGYIEAAKSIGLISGYTDGTFRPEQYLKVEELTAMVVRALGVKESELKGKWPLNYIQKAYSMNIFYGIESEIEIGKLVTRGQTAAILYNAFLNESLKAAKPVGLEIIDLQTLKVTFDKEISSIVKSDFSFDGGLSVVDAKFADSSKKVVEIKTSAQQEGKEYTLFYKGQATTLKFVAKTIPFSLAEDIKIESLKKVDLKFTKPISKSQQDNLPIKIYVNSKEITDVRKVLSSDFKTVSIIFPSRLNQTDKLMVEISNLLSETGQSLSITKELTVIDATQPKVVDFRVINSKKFKVIFTEPMNIDSANAYKVCDLSSVGANIRIDSNYVYAKVTPKHQENAIDIELLYPLADGNHTVEITEAKDFAGYKAPDYKATFTTVLEKNPPKLVSLDLVSNNRIRLVFDEEIRSLNGLIPTGEYEVYQAQDSTNHAIGAKITLLSDEKTIDIQLNPQLKLDSRALVSFEVRFRYVEDLLDNKVSDWVSVTSKAQDDTTKPAVKSVEVLDGNIIKVTFTENVNADGKVQSFSLLSADGTQIVETQAKVVKPLKEEDNSMFAVEFSTLAAINGGRYTLKISGICDTSVRENVMDSSTYAIDAKDTLAPTVTAAIAKYDSSSDVDKIDVFFSEPMDVEKLKNLSSYFVGASSATIPLSSIKGAKVDYISPNGDRITLLIPGADDTSPGKWSQSGGVIDKLAAPTLTDKAGNFLANATIAMPVSVSANFRGISAQDIEVVAVDKNTIELRALNGYIFASFDPAAIMFRNAYSTSSLNGNPDNDKVVSLGIVSYTISQDKKTITLKTSISLTSSAMADTNDSGQDAEQLKIFTVNSNIKDQFEQSLVIPPTLDISFYPSILLKDKISPQQTGVSVGSGNQSDTIAITFDETVFSLPGINTTVLAAGIELKVGGITLIPDVDYAAYIQNGIVYVKVKKPGTVDSKISLEIKRPDLIVDSNGNSSVVLKAQTVEHVTERTSPDVTAEFSSTDTRKVKLTFSEPMDASTLIAQNFSCVAGGSIVSFVKSSDNRVVEITFTNPLPAGSIVNISPNVKDLAGNSVSVQAVRK
ncbi:S-layer domain-containing protein [Caldicellulosiruptor acetigenus I77R1B]|uniref:S-layer domain-containing protein n=1 Tax=Caldicellulosiruptor acetigenus (strain ATCC 700853 / DSM 12137 / I77R1B) TaxID=632335 RepID=E4S6C8_CALA7|nr:Ig-like domain-containing protein [Caldicellulosiruptor acetigenus]ADQ41686.1 S-layer domain-containing protein [Caldicellulosiruptor acetigenus I77R1B]